MPTSPQTEPVDLLVIDGLNLLFRNHHRLEELSRSDGQQSGALYGTIRAILSAQKELNPAHIIVAAEGGNNKRKDLYPDYKINRTVRDPSSGIGPQIGAFFAVLRAWGIMSIGWDGYEADDIMATLAYNAQSRNHRTVLMTEDHDLKQCLSSHTKIWRTMRRGKHDEWVTMESFVEQYDGIEPYYYAHIQAMTGCGTDGIPGVKGIGEKTAVKFLNKHGSLDAATLNEPKLVDHREMILRNLGLTILCRQIDPSITHIGSPIPIFAHEPHVLREILETWELTSVITQFEKEGILKPPVDRV